MVPKFMAYRHILVDGLSNHSAAIFPTLPVKEGDRVLDVGCGFGDTAILLAQKVGAGGKVTGIDCCSGFLDEARKDTAAAGVNNLDFIEADVQFHEFEPEYDFVFSRFGTQFFENPVAGLRKMHAAMKPDGHMVMIVWRGLTDNPCMYAAKEIVAEFLPPPGEDALTCGPGPFSMADVETTTQMLKSAGYEQIEFEQVDAPIMIGETVDAAIDFQLTLGPAGEIFREAGDLAEERRAEIVAALATMLSPHQTSEGVFMGSSSWKITARKS
jgi:ubiquinone/menaquinone biosynthesis C-methylase UbiE